MGRSNLIPITRIYDIYPKYTYSVDVKKFMDEIVDIDRANVYTKDEVIAKFTELKHEIDEVPINPNTSEKFRLGQATAYDKCELLVQQKIDKLNEE